MERKMANWTEELGEELKRYSAFELSGRQIKIPI